MKRFLYRLHHAYDHRLHGLQFPVLILLCSPLFAVHLLSDAYLTPVYLIPAALWVGVLGLSRIWYLTLDAPQRKALRDGETNPQ
jgi:hypothetical protein